MKNVLLKITVIVNILAMLFWRVWIMKQFKSTIKIWIRVSRRIWDLFIHGIMESCPPSPSPPSWKWDRGSFIVPWGTLNFRLPLGGGVNRMGFLKIIHFFWGGGGQGFLYWGDGGVPLSLARNLLIQRSPGKVPQ